MTCTLTERIKEKSLHPLVPRIFIEGIHAQFRRFDGMRVGDPRPCPRCGCEDVQRNGYTNDPRTFARLITDDGFETITGEVQLLRCSRCGNSFQADLSEWFYDDLHYAKPVIDLCLFHAAEKPYHACERLLQNLYGLQVDRDTIRNYVIEFGDEFAERHGVQIAGCTVSQNFLSFLFGVETVEELQEAYAEELDEEGIEELVGVADETYPAKKGAKKELYEENMRRKQEDEELKKRLDSYTLGCSYLPQLECFAGLQCRNTSFAWLLALALGAPLDGIAYWITDDNDSYNGVLDDRILCAFHELRGRAREDERVQTLDEAGELEEIRGYLREMYGDLSEEKILTLIQKAPSLWDETNDEFTGPVSTNAIEGGNWRLKRRLGVPYERCQSIRGRALLGALRDSVSTFKAGQPAESFALRNGDARFEKLLGSNEQNEVSWNLPAEMIQAPAPS